MHIINNGPFVLAAQIRRYVIHEAHSGIVAALYRTGWERYRRRTRHCIPVRATEPQSHRIQKVSSPRLPIFHEMLAEQVAINSTDSLVNTLMLYSINTGRPPIRNLATPIRIHGNLLRPRKIIIHLLHMTVYVNSLLAVLNTRGALRKRNAGMISIPQSPSSVEPVTMNFIEPTDTKTNSEPASPDVARTRAQSFLSSQGLDGTTTSTFRAK
ncbi:hypothetical protein CVT25_000571 [Psilocybe cyanescens]|uniref:DUF6534 domain-containing protein n=1 Tax=Psilocybe cyanescens TaxID=93625 RepID=A0A409WZS2_PSICY|nr:hypothetical protein CVT25_000571 [Psilocybe cyanescens]